MMMDCFSNLAQASAAAVGFAVGIALEYNFKGGPISIALFIIAAVVCAIAFVLPHKWNRDKKMQAALALLCLVSFGLMAFDASVTKNIEWVPLGFWSVMFLFYLYRWSLLNKGRKR